MWFNLFKVLRSKSRFLNSSKTVVACPGAGSKRVFVILVFTVNLVNQEKTKQEKHQSKEEKEFG